MTIVQHPPTDIADQLRWLVDRAAVFDVMVEYTRCIDAREFERQTELMTDDGYIVLPFARIERCDLPRVGNEHLGGYGALQHQIANPLITIEGDRATLRCNFEAVHVNGDPGDLGGTDHGDVGGVYEASLRRQPGGWKLARVKTVFLWRSGRGAPGG